jgi:type IV pilus assembly protein PilA
MKRMQKGFTLIELMIVVAIIGILAAVAIPQYQDYTVKAKLSKSAGYVAPLKTALAVYNQENGGFPTVADAWNSLGMTTPSTTPEVSTVAIAATTGVITIGLNNIKAAPAIDTTSVSMTPTAGATAITWANSCTSTEPVVKAFFKC